MNTSFPMVGRAVLAAHEAGLPAPSAGALMMAAAVEARYNAGLKRLSVVQRCAERLLAASAQESACLAITGGAG